MTAKSSPLAPTTSRFVFLHVLIFCAAALPVLFLILLVQRYAVPIPALDDWEMAPLIAKAHTGGLPWSDIFAQQQESRTFFPKLIFILFTLGHYWDPRVEMMLSILICSLTSFGIFLLLRRSAVLPVANTMAFLFSVLLIFSPVQHELWLLASGFPSFVPALCVVWGLVVIQTNFPLRAKFALCAALAVFSSFTLANGLLAWGLSFPVLFVIQRAPAWKRWAGSWLVAGAGCAALYFWNYIKPHDLPPFAPSASPIAYGQYLLLFLGSGLTRSGNKNPLIASSTVGAILLLLYLGALGYTLFRYRDQKFRARVFPWLALGLYSIGSGCLAALGRIEWGVAQALESRYVAFSLYLTVAVTALVAIIAGEVAKATSRPGARLGLFTAVVLVGAIYLTLDFLCAAASVPWFKLRSAAGRLGHGAVLFSQVLNTSEVIRTMNYPRPPFVEQNADALDRLHLMRTSLVRTKEIRLLRHAEVDGKVSSGWVDGLVSIDGGRCTAWGWAALTGKGRPADCVVLAYENQKGEWILFTMSNAVERRPDVARALNDREQLWTGWRATFPSDAIPSGAKISAWAVDAKLYRLKENMPQLKL